MKQYDEPRAPRKTMNRMLALTLAVACSMVAYNVGSSKVKTSTVTVEKEVTVEVPVEKIVEKTVEVEKVVEVTRLPSQCDVVFNAMPRVMDAASDVAMGMSDQQQVMSDAGIAIMQEDWVKLRDLQVVQLEIKKDVGGAYIEMSETLMAYENNINKCKGASK